jgi:hypothetical protein
MRFGQSFILEGWVLHYHMDPTSEHELYLKLFVTNGGGW